MLQTQPRPSKRRKAEGEEEADELGEEEFVPAVMSGRILRQAREQREEVDADDAPPAAAVLAASGAGGLVAAAAKGLRDSDSEDELSGAPGWQQWQRWGRGARGQTGPPLSLCCMHSCIPLLRPFGQAPPTPHPPTPPHAADGYASEGGYEFEEEIEVSPEDEAALAAFMAPDAGASGSRSRGGLCDCRAARQGAAAAGWGNPTAGKPPPGYPCTHFARVLPPLLNPNHPDFMQTTTGNERWQTWCSTRFGRSRQRQGWRRCPGALYMGGVQRRSIVWLVVALSWWFDADCVRGSSLASEMQS